MGIVQCYSLKQLGPRPLDGDTVQPTTTEAPPTKEERARSPLYGSSNGALCASPTTQHVDFNPSLLHDSGREGDRSIESSHQLDGGPDSAVSTDKDETKL